MDYERVNKIFEQANNPLEIAIQNILDEKEESSGVTMWHRGYLFGIVIMIERELIFSGACILP